MSESGIQKFLRSEISFYIALIGAVFSFAAFYFGVSNRIDLLAQKLDYIAQDNQKFEVRIQSLEKTLTDFDRRITTIETKLTK